MKIVCNLNPMTMHNRIDEQQPVKKGSIDGKKLTDEQLAELFEKSTVTLSSVTRKDYEDNSKKQYEKKNKTTAK
jgi:hypothetical protein